MRTEQINVYKFYELSEQAKKVAMQEYSDINTCDDWWSFVYEDIGQIGAKIEGFDLDKRQIDGELIDSAYEVADKITANHGEETDTYKLAIAYKNDWDSLVTKHSDGVKTDRVAQGKEQAFDDNADELEASFRKNLLKACLKMLQIEYDYRVSNEAIIESINSNDYEFYASGKIYYNPGQ
jgi:hypothetical protein